MATREDRMNQRLRGAQRRDIKDVDFGLSFPVFAPAQEAAEPAYQSPLPEAPLRPQLSSRRTPANRNKGSAILTEKTTSATVLSANDANTSAKRRKLNTDSTPSTSSRGTRSSQRIQAPRPDIYELPEDEVQDEVSGGDISTGSVIHVPAATPEVDTSVPEPSIVARTPIAALREADEVTESPQDAPGSGQRRRANIANSQLASSQLQMVQNDSFVSSVDTPPSHRKRKQREAVASTSIKNSRTEQIETVDQSPEDEFDELSPEQPVRRGRAQEHSPELEEPNLPEEIAKAEAIDDEEAAVVLKKNRGRRISRNIREESVDLDSSAMSKTPPKKKAKRITKVVTSPVKRRQPKKSAVPPQVTKKAPKRAKVRAGSPIPVTVHRLSRPLIFDEDELDADILNLPMSHTKRAGVNAIDVLSQICQEIVSSGMETLEEGGNNCDDPALRREYKTKWNAVAFFGNELQSRLLEHTINLDNGYSLERRVRDEQKKKLGLREEVLRIRAEREQIALQMDEIRIGHEKERNEGSTRDGLNTTIHDVELAIDLGKAASTDESIISNDLIGTELLLKRVASEVSNKGSSGGLLNQIKEFNAFLERAAAALENRRT